MCHTTHLMQARYLQCAARVPGCRHALQWLVSSSHTAWADNVSHTQVTVIAQQGQYSKEQLIVVITPSACRVQGLAVMMCSSRRAAAGGGLSKSCAGSNIY